MDREELIQAIAEGDEAAFREFYRETAKTVYSFILSLGITPQEAEDVMQDTYLTLWMRAGEYEARGKPLAWMFTIAKNLCYMRFREQKKIQAASLEAIDCETGGVDCPDIEKAPERELLLSALRQLKPKERQVLLLYGVAGLKHREVAEALNMPLATELSRYSRSVKKMEKNLKNCLTK